MELLTKIRISAVMLVCGVIASAAFFLFLYQEKTMSFKRVKSYIDVPHEAITKTTLENGMNILVFKNESVPKVLLQIAYDVGSYVETSGERGLAHLLEHMIFKGTNKLSEVDIDGLARKYGATFNAFTSADVTSYYFETNKNNWKPFVEILADCMTNSRFEEQHLASEIKAVIQELKMGRDDHMRVMMYKALTTLFPAHHPYHDPVIGYKEDLLGISAAKLREFYKKYYRADRATLFVVGDVDPDEIIQEVKKSFGSITVQGEKATTLFPVLVKEPQATSVRIYEDINREFMTFYWLIPGLNDKHSLYASAIEGILGGEGGRLHQLLVDDKKVATSTYVKAMSFLQAGIFFIVVEPVLGKSDKCRAYIQKELTNIINEGVSDYELERMVKIKQSNFLQSMQSHSSFVYRWIQSYFSVHNELDVFERLNKLNDVSSTQLQGFAMLNLDPFLMNQIELLPLPETKKQLKQTANEILNEFDQEIVKQHQRTKPLEEPKALLTAPEATKLDFTFPKPDREFELENGLKIRLRKQGMWPLLSAHCQFKDAYYFTASKQGIILDLMMSMLIEGSTNYSKKEHLEFLDLKGCHFYTGKSGIHASLLRSDTEKVLKRILTIISTPVFPEEAFEVLKTISIQSFEGSKDSPIEVISRLLKNNIYKDNDYHWTFDNAISMIKSTTVTDLMNIHNQHVNPESMILSVVGNFDLDDMEKMINKVFSEWKNPGSYQKITPPTPSFEPKQKIDHPMLRDQVTLLLGQPSSITLYHDDYVPLKILSYICFHSLGSRLYQLREQTGIFYSGFGALSAHASRHQGFDYVGVIVSKGKVNEAEKMLHGLMAGIAEHGIKQHELDAARQLYLKELIDIISTNGAVARMFCQLDALDLGYDYYDNVLKRAQSITVEELNSIARKYISTKNMMRIRVGAL